MKNVWMTSTIVAITLAAGAAAAQAPPPPAPGGAFERLSPGNQKIALAILEAEHRAGTSASTGASTKPLSLDQIAAMKQSGQGWGEIYKGMKSQGLVHDKNLGQAVSRASRGGGGASSTRTEITTASGRTMIVGGHERSDVTVSSGRRGSGSEEARGNAGTGAAVSHGGEGGSSGSPGRGGSGSHGAGRGK